MKRMQFWCNHKISSVLRSGEVWKIVSVFPFFKKITDIWKLLCKKRVLRCAFAKEFEVFWIVKSRDKLTKLGAYRSSHRKVSARKGVLRNFANFTGQHMCRSLFFNRVAGLMASGLQLYQNRDSGTGVFRWILWNF